jgi:hypothetical protein
MHIDWIWTTHWKIMYSPQHYCKKDLIIFPLKNSVLQDFLHFISHISWNILHRNKVSYFISLLELFVLIFIEEASLETCIWTLHINVYFINSQFALHYQPEVTEIDIPDTVLCSSVALYFLLVNVCDCSMIAQLCTSAQNKMINVIYYELI